MKRTYLAMLAAIVVLGSVLVATTTASASSEGKRTRITMMIGGINKVIYATATLAKNLGYYEKAGVDIYPLDSPAGVEEADALVAGQIDAAMG
jgi:NitT/TauT family transport system substrate-binding protein